MNITVKSSGARLDKYLSQEMPELSRTRLQKLIAGGLVTVNGESAKASQILNVGDSVSVTVPPPAPTGLVPRAMPLNIVFEDDDVIVIDKPAGLPVHPSPGHADDTLVNAVLARFPNLPGIGGSVRPGIVHRLDKDTSGLMVIAKNDAAMQHIQKQFKLRTMLKRYLTLIKGNISPDEGTIEAPIGRDPQHRQKMAVVSDGRQSRTHYRVLQRLGEFTLLEVTPHTGRTHQIRVHLAAIGFPVVGDAAYGYKVPFLGRQFLHASRLGFTLPSTGEQVEFNSKLPADLQSALQHLS